MWNIVIPCGGLGSRLANIGNSKPKPLIEVQGKTLIEHSILSFDIEAKFIFVTRTFEDQKHNEELSKLLKRLRPESQEIRINKVTSGASETVLAAKNLINNDTPLVVYNCDQILSWDPYDFVKWVNSQSPLSSVVLYNSNDPKNSFAKIEDGFITHIKEKNPISNDALVGFHYWQKGRDFVKSAELLLDQFHSNGSPECYLSETYNYLDKSKIMPYYIASHHYKPLGTPEDISKFIGRSLEYSVEKPSTIFIDLDGTILKHNHAISLVHMNKEELIPGVREKLDQWDSIGHKIIIVTARKESERELTKTQLSNLAVPYDLLIMGCTNGNRILINDKISADSKDRSLAVNVFTDSNFKFINWGDYGL